jgi:hypothetical protein
MTITARPDSNPYAFARFIWSDDGKDCDLVAGDLDDETIDRLIAAKVHEGADLDGWTVDLDWHEGAA